MKDEQTLNGGSLSECLGCELIETAPKTLREGKVVCSSCELWRMECEARMVVSMNSLEKRREYLASVKQERGQEAAEALQDEVRALWKVK